MHNVSVPDVEVVISIEGDTFATFQFYKTERAPHDWETTGTINHPDGSTAMRAVLLACVGELDKGGWELFTFEAESGSTEDDQPQLPWN